MKSYAIIGTGGRSPMFLEPIASTFREEVSFAAFCDTSAIRMKYQLDELRRLYGYAGDIPFYTPDQFDRMIAETRPDAAVICTPDFTHAEYIVRCLDAGLDVVVEKPIAIDAAQCLAIQEAVKRTGREVRVTFNYRWVPGPTRVWELLREGIIGRPRHVHLEYLLNTRHGADYFRRWHARMECSGGLLVHKSTHHFDLVNWWLDGIPETVQADGRLSFYGKENAMIRGDDHLAAYDRYLDAPEGHDDPFHLDLRLPGRDVLYLEAEKDSGYIRDRNVFRDDINIFDTMSVSVTYRDGTILTYSLVAYAPYEGYRVSFTGDQGRLEYAEMHASHLIVGEHSKTAVSHAVDLPAHLEPFSLRVLPHFKDSWEVEVAAAQGTHGGSDPLLQEQIFGINPPWDHARRNAGWQQGLASALVGIAANRSIAEGRKIEITSLLDFAPDAENLSQLV